MVKCQNECGGQKNAIGIFRESQELCVREGRGGSSRYLINILMIE